MKEIRSCHPYAYRSGKWAEVLFQGPIEGRDGRECYIVRFADGVSDTLPVEDPVAEYEFREAACA